MTCEYLPTWLAPQVIRCKRVRPNAIIPKRATPGAAGLDLHAALEATDCGVKTIWSGRSVLVSTGIAVEIPPGFEGKIRGRSGNNVRGVYVRQTGTIDSDYRGELMVLITVVYGSEDFFVHDGDRIAQLIISPIWGGELVEAGELSGTARGDGGFGSTGK